MSGIGHNSGEINPFEVYKIDGRTSIGSQIFGYIQKVSGGVHGIIVPKVYIKCGEELKFQIKPDAYIIFEDNNGELVIRGIEECTPEGFYEKEVA